MQAAKLSTGKYRAYKVVLGSALCKQLSFVVQSMFERLFCVNAPVSQSFYVQKLSAPNVFLVQETSLTVRSFWRAKELR